MARTKIRTDQAAVSITFEGQDFGLSGWRAYSGADITSSSAKSRPGSMGDETDEGGPATRNDATLMHEWTLTALSHYKDIQNMAGWGDVSILVQWIDRKTKKPLDDGQYTKTGTLKGCSDPDFDSQGNAVGALTVVVGLDEKIA